MQKKHFWISFVISLHITFCFSYADTRVIVPLFQPSLQAPLSRHTVPSNASFFRVHQTLFDALKLDTLQSFDIPDFPLSAGSLSTLHCTKIDVLSPGAVVVEGTHNGDQARRTDKHLLLRAQVDGVDGSFAYLAIFRNYVIGFIEVPEGDKTMRILIAPDDVDSPEPVMIVYRQSDVPTPPRPSCDVEQMSDYQSRVNSVFDELQRSVQKSGPIIQNSQTLLANIAIDCDTKYYQEQGSNFSRATNYVLVVMGAVSAVYERDVNVRMQVPYLRIWTESCPYSGELGAMLGQVQAYWNANMQSVKRTTTYMMTSYTGGLAWVGVLCSSYAYSVGGIGGGTNFPVNQYAWDVDVVSHELGHNFGSPHTHSCGWAPPVDSCVTAEGGCYAQPLPRRGTIMSYCHLTNFGTELKFHPRVATLIRASAQRSLNTCVRNASQPFGFDVAATSIQNPALGSTMASASSFVPQATVTNLGTQTAQNFSVILSFSSLASSAVVYSRTVSVPTLNPGASLKVSFDPSVLTTGSYLATLIVTLTGDADAANNSLTRPFLVGNAKASSLSILYPNGAEQFNADSVVTVRWKHTNVSTALIELSTDAGMRWSTLQTYQTANDQQLSWKIPAVNTDRALIRITDMQNSSTSDLSDSFFSIRTDVDCQSLEFVLPASDTTIVAPFTPKVLFRNNGIKDATACRVSLRLRWRDSGTIVYDQTVNVASLNSASTSTVIFPLVKDLPPGQFIMEANIFAQGDRLTSNDTLARSFSHNGGIAPPVGLKAQAVDKAVLLWWGPSTSSGISSYVLYRRVNDLSFDQIAVLAPSVLSFVDDNCINGSSYAYVVVALRKTERSINSNEVIALPKRRILYDSVTVVKTLVPESGSKNVPNPTLCVWSNVAHAMWYQVQISQGNDMNNVILNYIVESSRPLSVPLSFRQNYSWRVRAFNHHNTTSWSAISTFTLGTSCAGNCLNFSTNSDNLQAPTFEWKGQSSTTVEFWNFVASADLSSQLTALRIGADVVTNRFLIHAPYRDGNMYWDYGNINTSGRLSVDYKPYLDKWTHVAVVSDGKTFKAIYLDGRLVASSTVADQPENLTGLNIGLQHRGRVDEFRIWNTVRSADDIYANMSKRLDAGASNLIGYYKFDEPLKDTILGDQGSAQAAAYLNRSNMRTASDAPINCPNTSSLQAPNLLAPTNAERTEFLYPQLRWTVVSSASAYEIQLSKSSDFLSSKPITLYASGVTNTQGSQLSLQAQALQANTRYHWRVRALTHQLVGAWSDTWSFVTDTVCRSSSIMFDGSFGASAQDFKMTSSEVTIEWWNYVDSLDVRNASAFAVGTKDDAGNRCQATAPWGDKNLYWDFGSLTSGRISTSYANYLSKWTHVALVSNGRNFKAIYLDGVLVASVNQADSSRDLSVLHLGQQINDANTMKGRMSEFRIWNRVRTREEIANSMNKRINDHPNLLACWHMDEGVGQSFAEARFSDTTVRQILCAKMPQWSLSSLPLLHRVAEIIGPDTVRTGQSYTYKAVVPKSAVCTWLSVPEKVTASILSGREASLVFRGTDSVALVELQYIDSAGCAQSSRKEVVVLQNSSNVNEHRSLVQTIDVVKVAPNPARDEVLVQFYADGPTQVEIYNNCGQSVFHALVEKQFYVVSLNIPLQNMSSGVYCIRFANGSASKVATLCVIR